MIRNVACGISGGVDSAIAAYFLKKKFNVIGVFMTNWDLKDETSICSMEEDRENAKYVCNKLRIPFREVNFVKDYWVNVFENTINDYEKGFTPNPDIMCNKHIKFNSFARYCLENLKVDAFATGHYARSSFGSFLEGRNADNQPLLMRPLDRVKDQTFWLCQVNVDYLAKCMFPLSNITKLDVKKLALEIGLNKTVSRKESMGICFIGKRKFRNFIDSYIEPKHGIFTLLESGKIIGEHKGVHHYTLGQKSGLSCGQDAAYVAHINPLTQEIKVVLSGNHPALFMRKLITGEYHWLMSNGSDMKNFRSRIQYQNKYCSVPCSVKLEEKEHFQIELDDWFRCISPGQYAVLYSEDDEICLGSSQILSSTSAWDEGYTEPIPWNINDYENRYLHTS